MPSHASATKTATGGCTEVFDPNFKYMYMVPSHLVVHTPPARLNISRLVACRNYVPGKEGSCTKEERCRFVHADVDFETLEAQPIHVNYIWRHEDLCTYDRLPPGDVLEVVSRSGSHKVDLIPSERILVTRRALACRDANAWPLSHCVHYYCNRMCNRGENCNFIHAVYVDPNSRGDFKRAPVQPMPRVNTSTQSTRTDNSDLSSVWINQFSMNGTRYSALSNVNRAAVQVPVQTLMAESGAVSLPGVVQETEPPCMEASGVSAVSATSAPLEGGVTCLQRSGVSPSTGSETFSSLQLSTTDGGRQRCLSVSYNTIPQASVKFPLGMPSEVNSVSYMSGKGTNNMGRQVLKSLEGSMGRCFVESPAGFTASPATPMQESGALTHFSLAPSPYQMPLSSPYDASFTMWNGSIRTLSGGENHSMPMGQRPRAYRHNPYLPVQRAPETAISGTADLA
ncbi:zinc finger protein family memeber [Trypanosoma grayi]|uniref:zinc finger protein family memeber n=1 Tax=Trypanosoma grayi TaxID=71804 RepID=UPI0004F4957F|nr:zinc finger protein family memeber [Trypanosoma grayi]KEG07993.1 zinc finger protein family memeber [Trypanosoma grayi]